MRNFEDIEPGRMETGATFTVDRRDMVEFARRWDPRPIHLDDEVANQAFGDGGAIAAGAYVMAVRTRLLVSSVDLSVVAGLGWDDVRFQAPVRAGDHLQLRLEWLSKRPSTSRPDCGIVRARISLVNQDGVNVMTHIDNILVHKR